MTVNQYLTTVLVKYKSQDITLYKPQLASLVASLKTWANSCYLDIKYSGSYAKGTAVSLSSDVDIFISLTSNCEKNTGGLTKIYNSLGTWLQNKGFKGIRQQNVSYRITLAGLKVDITPGRKRSGNTNVHSLHVSKGSTWVQSSPQRHITDVASSGRTDEIRLLKIWKELHKLEFPSIYLEYLTMNNLLYGKAKGASNLGDNFFHILNQLASDQSNPLASTIKDPANSNNNLSNLLSNAEKIKIRNAAKISIHQSNWNQIVW